MSDWNAPEVPRAPERSGEGREWKLIEKMMLGLHAEQRKARRWGIFFKLLTFVYLFALIFMLRSPVDKEAMASSQSHVAIIDVKGMILEDEDASADNLVGSLREAFKSEKVKGIILRINSPGGSPVQAGYVYDEINRLRVTRP
ncbi:MAG: S49 family peptidase, partial [Gammaproteobacteria bacterium]|nr:S49 family peptidase [Gammaproteobacteria bacterium]